MDSITQQPSISVSSTFAAFRHRNYRLWFFGQLISLVGTWMQNAAQGYLIFSLTHSAAFLGYTGFVSGLPAWVFMLYGGFIADRVPRRTLMIITQTAMMVLAFILAALVFTNVVQPWHILVLAFLLGVANAFDVPARQSFVVELVAREDMTNAIALNATMFNLGAIVGPAIGGVIYALTGPGWCFTINGISFIAVIIGLALMRITLPPPPPHQGSAWGAIVQGFRYVRSDRLVLTLTTTVFFINIFGWSLMTLLPAWAVNVLHGDVTTNGLLLSARGIGAVIGGLAIAALSTRGIRGKMWATSSFILPVMMTVFAFMRWLPFSLLVLTVIGFALITIMNNSNAMVQSRVPDELRGRVMGLYSLMFMGGGPIGALMVGLMADGAGHLFPRLGGEPVTVIFCAVMALAYAAAIWVFRPEVRRMK
ncbi:MAG TPA: MFS transporter [Anaerolineaceae bacterium]